MSHIQYPITMPVLVHVMHQGHSAVPMQASGSRGWAMSILISKPTLQKLKLPLSLKTAGALIIGIRNVKIVNFHW